MYLAPAPNDLRQNKVGKVVVSKFRIFDVRILKKNLVKSDEVLQKILKTPSKNVRYDKAINILHRMNPVKC